MSMNSLVSGSLDELSNFDLNLFSNVINSTYERMVDSDWILAEYNSIQEKY